MAIVKICLAVCGAAMLLTQGESRQLCGQEIEYRGFNPIDALQMIQARQFQEFEQFKNTLSQLKFKLQTDDYFAWKRCLSEYEKEKLRYLQSVEKCKSSFNGLVQSLTARKLDAAQYELELQKIFQQFQTQFTPAANLFKTNIKYLYDTIRDDGLRKKWWSTVKTTEEVTTSDGKTTRSSITQVDSGVGNQRTQSITKKSQSVSSSGGYDAQSSGSSYDAASQRSASGYDAASQRSASGYDAASQRSASGYGSSSQQSVSGYSASQQSGGYDSQQRSGYAAVSKTKEVKKESATVTGSTVDNSGINFSNTQTRSGLKEAYSTNSYKASNGGYRRRRRTLGLLGLGVGVGVGTGLAGGAAGVGANVNVGLGGGKSGYGQQQQQQQEYQQQSMNSRSSLGYGGNGMGGGISNGMGGASGGYDNSGAGGYQARASKYQESSKSEFQQAQGAGYASAQKYSESVSSTVGGGNGY